MKNQNNSTPNPPETFCLNLLNDFIYKNNHTWWLSNDLHDTVLDILNNEV